MDLSKNKITEVPSSLGLAPKLKELKLEGNPFRDKKVSFRFLLSSLAQFIKLIESGTSKTIILHLKKSAPKPKKEEPPPKRLRIRIDNPPELKQVKIFSNQTVRPHILLTIFKGIKFTEESFKKFIDMQTGQCGPNGCLVVQKSIKQFARREPSPLLAPMIYPL